MLVGDGPEEGERLKAMARELGLGSRVHFTGLRADGAQLVGALDVIALPSLTEAMPVVALEAAAYKIPMVSSRVGAMPQILLEGEAGWLIAPGDVGGLAQSIKQAFSDSGRKAAKSYQNLLENFTIERQIDAWCAALKRCLKPGIESVALGARPTRLPMMSATSTPALRGFEKIELTPNALASTSAMSFSPVMRKTAARRRTRATRSRKAQARCRPAVSDPRSRRRWPCRATLSERDLAVGRLDRAGALRRELGPAPRT